MIMTMERLREDARLRVPATDARAFPFDSAALNRFHDTWTPDACISALNRIIQLEESLETAMAIINRLPTDGS